MNSVNCRFSWEIACKVTQNLLDGQIFSHFFACKGVLSDGKGGGVGRKAALRPCGEDVKAGAALSGVWCGFT